MVCIDLINICNFTWENDRNKQWEGKWLWKKSYLKYTIFLVPYVYFMLAVPAFINNNMYYTIEINYHIQQLIKKEKLKPSNMNNQKSSWWDPWYRSCMVSHRPINITINLSPTSPCISVYLCAYPPDRL